MYKELQERVYDANMALKRNGLITLTWGNVSMAQDGVMAIKPSGVPYESLRPSDIVIIDRATQKQIHGTLKPSSDTPTHLYLYDHLPQIGGIVHTHSRWATIFAQAGKAIPAFGTTHADTFYGSVPCTRPLSKEEIETKYEENTGKVIVETVKDPVAIPAILIEGHGPFAWGKDANEAVEHAIILEEVAMMAYHTLTLKGNANPIDQHLLDKHYLRKHGKDAYYGQ